MSSKDTLSLAEINGSIHFAFDGPMTKEDLEKRIRIITDTIYSLGGHPEDGRGECCQLYATEVESGKEWQGGGEERDYARSGDKLTLQVVLGYFNKEVVDDFLVYTNDPRVAVICTEDVYVGHPFEITQIHVSKNGRVLAVFSYDKEVDMKKKDFASDTIEILHRIRPHP